ncbi:hypothetical protein PIB30_037108 [Stylosanthes scabra]|uniref:Uncharacterized protein n=1 Tax=Stylosanthes scabra TaxID=79078 RepID=A0ABU6YFK9_9FABA|nr:hypothetical protein [Stylosanthes scabra]
MSSFNSDSKNLKVVECSPFLPRSRRCNGLSDPSKIKAIEEGRKELMEMVQGMPDSSFELSFQDMVVHDKQVLQSQPYQDEENKKKQSLSNSSGKGQAKKPKKTKKSESINRPKQMMRVESMDSASFLLKMFIPTSLTKLKVKNASKDWSVKSCGSGDDRGCGDKSWYIRCSYFVVEQEEGGEAATPTDPTSACKAGQVQTSDRLTAERTKQVADGDREQPDLLSLQPSTSPEVAIDTGLAEETVG